MYAGKVRVRASGLLIEEKKLLLVKLTSPATGKDIWIPPGGGVKLGEPLKEAVKREFLEEAGLSVKVKKLVHINEFIDGDYHALEFFFTVDRVAGSVDLGIDPEREATEQILQEIGFFTEEQIGDTNISPDYIRDKLWSHNDEENINMNFFK